MGKIMDRELGILRALGEREIIDGKVYATRAARLLATYSSGGFHFSNYNDPSEIRMSLYQKVDGEYFLVSGGNLPTRFSYSEPKNLYGRGIEPITEGQAKDWVKKYASTMYEIIFDKPYLWDFDEKNKELAAKERNIGLNMVLHDKMETELKEFKERLLSLDPEDILSRAEGYTARVNVLKTCCRRDLPDEQAEALVKLDNPLAVLSKAWEDNLILIRDLEQDEKIWHTVQQCAHIEEIHSWKRERTSASQKETDMKQADKKKPAGPRL